MEIYSVIDLLLVCDWHIIGVEKLDTKLYVWYDVTCLVVLDIYYFWNVLRCPSGPGSFYFGGCNGKAI